MIRVKVEAIDNYLNSNGIKQKFVSDQTGISTNALTLTLNNKRKLLADEYIKICNVLGVPYDFFVDKAS